MTRQWIESFIQSPSISAIAQALRPGLRLAASGSWGSSSHLVAAALQKITGRPVLLIVGHLDEADEAAEDIGLLDSIRVAQFPALEVMPGETNVSLELLSDRLSLIGRLLESDQPDLMIAPIQALMQAVPEPQAISSLVFDLRQGQTMDPQTLVHWLGEAGYTRVDAIDQPGDFAVRGGIVDVFPPGNLPPVRVDFFGDEVESLWEIDMNSMGSLRKLPEARFIGASVKVIQEEQRTTSLWKYLRPDTLVIFHEILEISEQARGYYERVADARGLYSPKAVFEAAFKLANLQINQFPAPALADQTLPLSIHPLLNFDKDAATAIKQLLDLATIDPGEQGRAVVVLCVRPAEMEHLRQLLSQHPAAAAANISIEQGYLFRGFEFEPTPDGPRLILIPQQELFHRYQARRRLRRITSDKAIDSFVDLEPGDYVVHNHHGIARFKGLRTLKKESQTVGEEYLTLEFADRALMHVPASQIELVQKYIGGFAGRPPLSKLGGARWKKQKEQALEGARELAAELLRVQAARAAMPGIAYPQDTDWTRQFDAEFPYQETQDQLAAIQSVKKDMSDPQPMDRLICGDVGYGKTEIAMRAAFKAMEAGKQVAILCPTTVLCEQHERSFRQRLAGYPFRIDALNRFKLPSDVRQTLEDLSAGRVDLIIGTHRLLSEDALFRELGLVVIDEEQKFGVEHKNRLMRFRLTVDVLTLSATPIPRTLHLSLLGLRDISSLSTPPSDRRAIVTEVVARDPAFIRRAILRELNRQGQCFFVHNRVHNIHDVEMELRALVPEARFIVGHGQLSGHELEQVMHDFIDRKADVLICTTIIESGIDIPSVNTIFIQDADRFGLAEMHQLRGRVGRYKHRAYCYLMMPADRPITEIAARRLRAIEEFSMLGAGFKIAMRDMEIRGVGNLLGKEQSGHIATVGYDMYCQLLDQATHQLRNEPVTRAVETHLELGVSGHLPKPYIASDKYRMDAYRRICRAQDLPSLRQVELDLTQAYGDPPAPARALLLLAEVRIALSIHRAESLKLHEQDLIFTTDNVRTIGKLLEHAPGSVRIVDTPVAGQAGTIYYRPPANYLQEGTLLPVLRKLLVRPLEMVVPPAAPASPSPPASAPSPAPAPPTGKTARQNARTPRL